MDRYVSNNERQAQFQGYSNQNGAFMNHGLGGNTNNNGARQQDVQLVSIQQGANKPQTATFWGNNGGNGATTLDPTAQGVAAMDAAVRRGFIMKVFTILAIQLTITFGGVIAFTLSDDLLALAANNTIKYMSFAAYIGTVLAISCCPSVARSHPTGMILLGILTIALTFMAGITAGFSDQAAVFQALGGTVAICGALILFSCQTKYDFTGMGPYLLVASIAFIIFAIISIFVQSELLNTVFASVAIFLFGAYLVYDVQMIVGGNHKKYQLEVDEYIFAAMSVYLDIVLIFLYVLALTDSS